MTPMLLLASAVVVAGAVAVVGSRSVALVAIGAAVALAGTAFLADPIPAPVVLVERAIGGALAGELLWLGLRGRPGQASSALPWPAIALIAAAAYACGVAMHAAAAGNGPPEALGVAAALFGIALIAAAGRADGVQYGLAALLLVAGTSVVRTALAGPISGLETLVVAALGVAVAGVVPLVAVPRRPVTAAARPTGTPAGRGDVHAPDPVEDGEG